MVSIHRPPGYEPGALPLRHNANSENIPSGRQGTAYVRVSPRRQYAFQRTVFLWFQQGTNEPIVLSGIRTPNSHPFYMKGLCQDMGRISFPMTELNRRPWVY